MKRKTHPVVDKAEVSIDFLDKFYMGAVRARFDF